MPKKKEVVSKKITVPLYDQDGQLLEEIELNEEIFGLKVDQKLLSQYVRIYLANQEVPSAHTLTRGEVSGGGRKPWRQKGTGRARAGSTRAPHWRGGGVALGPVQVKVRLDMPKKMKRLALKEALSDKASKKEILVLENIELKENKTKEMNNLFKKLPVEKKIVLILEAMKPEITRAGRNLAYLKIKKASDLNAYEILGAKKLVILRKALEKLQENLIGQSPSPSGIKNV